jgi:putative transposase
MLPGDFPPSSTVYSYYRKWQRREIWEELNHTLRDQVREKLGRSTQPSALAKLAFSTRRSANGIAADSLSVKTTEKRGMCTALMEVKR